MRKQLLFGSILALTLTFVGCGGSGGNSNPVTNPHSAATTVEATSTPSIIPSLIPSPTPTLSPDPSPSLNPYSSDYCGWEPGFQVTYQVSEMDKKIDNGATKEYNCTQNTIDCGSGILKLVSSVQDSGSLILKENNNYYDYGTWYFDKPDSIEPTPYHLLVSTPFTNSLENSVWGKVKGQKLVTLPCGTFTAWIFEDIDEYESTAYSSKSEYYFWIVPYLGIVKYDQTDWENDKIVWRFKAELVAFVKGVPVKSGSLKSVQSKKTTSRQLNLFGKHDR